MMRKLLSVSIIGAIGVSAITLAACGNPKPEAKEIVYRKTVDTTVEPNKYSVWAIKDIEDMENIIVYEVPKDYYDTLSPGDTFDAKYAIGKGVTEVQIVDGIG